MSKKSNKNQSQPALKSLVDLGTLVTGGLDVEAAIGVVAPALLMGDYEIYLANEGEIERLRAAAEHIVVEFHATRNTLLAEYEGLLGEKGRILALRQGMVSRAFDEALKSASYQAAVSMYQTLQKDVSELPKAVRATLCEQAKAMYADELAVIEAQLTERATAYEAAKACDPNFIPVPAQDIIDEAAVLIKENAEIRESLAGALEKGGTW